MFDIGWDELLVIAIVALVVIGPKDLPHAFRLAGRWMARARTMAREFQSHIDDLMQESELNDLKREISDVPRPKIMDEIDSELMSGQLPAKPLAGGWNVALDPLTIFSHDRSRAIPGKHGLSVGGMHISGWSLLRMSRR